MACVGTKADFSGNSVRSIADVLAAGARQRMRWRFSATNQSIVFVLKRHQRALPSKFAGGE